MFIPFIFITIFKFIIDSPYCKEGENLCSLCNPITKLCAKCEKNIYTPDENGGCKASKKCINGNNYCMECDTNEYLCKNCEIGYFPDGNGCCSYTNNCEISYQGNCLKCNYDYILIGASTSNLKLCKSLNSEDLKNCQKINVEKGFCEECKEGFYLSKGDHKCIKTEYCYESMFGICKKCKEGYYLDKRQEKCLEKNEYFKNCIQTLDGKTCDICDDEYYLDEEGNCGDSNFCAKFGNDGLCEKCVSGYYPSSYDNSCTTEKECYYAYKDFGICHLCLNNYYIDLKDGKCKSNQEDNDYKYCYSVENGCLVCATGYELGADLRCSSSKNCIESEYGLCLQCQDNYYLGLDHICTKVENCIYSQFYDCIQCKDNYYYDKTTQKCLLEDDNFKNCQYVRDGVCQKCRDDYYLNQTDFLCYSNKEMGDYYKCAMTHENSSYCISCIKDYYYGYKYKKCSIIEGCENSFDEERCDECYSEYYCLDLKTGKCVINDEIEDENKKYYYKCNRTNAEGNACEICLDGFELENGLCIDKFHCIENDQDGSCKKCQNDENGNYCLNPIFGCIELYYDNCIECNDIFNLDRCTKCNDGYKIDIDNYQCYEIEN